ncbi:hypothetical protein Purlil1_12992 [Purpureocillium lilacinum]|uniref:Ankyrin repeats (3 copies) domain-containing protein n=1 Tax=Purpureocillium lilacinum TaxID=33203 RepID=A0ABR0BFB5_PURLI|nr:hypothetical protein Purlil1_12992 [Purpureocillium lilacinum]
MGDTASTIKSNLTWRKPSDRLESACVGIVDARGYEFGDGKIVSVGRRRCSPSSVRQLEGREPESWGTAIASSPAPLRLGRACRGYVPTQTANYIRLRSPRPGSNSTSNASMHLCSSDSIIKTLFIGGTMATDANPNAPSTLAPPGDPTPSRTLDCDRGLLDGDAPNTDYGNGCTALVYAAANGDEDTVKAFLE